MPRTERKRAKTFVVEPGFRRTTSDNAGVFTYFSQCRLCLAADIFHSKSERKDWERDHFDPTTGDACESFSLDGERKDYTL